MQNSYHTLQTVCQGNTYLLKRHEAEQFFPTVGLLLWIYSNEIQSYVQKPLEKQTNWMILQQALFVQSAFV